MMPFHKLLHPGQSPPHPVVRRWEYKRNQSGVVRLECELSRERDGLTFRPAELWVYFLNAEGKDAAAPDSELWEPRLDEWLLEKGIKARTHDNEAERFGYGFERRFAGAESRFGDGYFNAVLRQYLGQSDLAKLPAVAEKLGQIRENAPHRSAALADCFDMIETALSSVGADLTERLHYPDDLALEILGNSLAYYLDERYSITNRRMLGFR